MSKKRANGEGMIRQRKDGTWEGRYTIPGRAVPKSVYGKTQADVRKKLTASAHDLDNGIYMEPSKMSVGKWLDIWSSEYLGGVKPLTVSKYKSQIRMYLKPAFGALPLQQLNAPVIQLLYNSELKNGQAAKSICNLHGVLHKSLSQAVKLGYIRFNPSDACELPRIERPSIQPLEGDQVGRFLEAIKDTKYDAFYTVIMFTGMRQGEALGLTWDCVDFKNGAIKIYRQLQKERIEGGGGEYHFMPLKNDKTRVITPALYVFDILRRVRLVQNENRIMHGSEWQNSMNLVFTHEDGKHLSANTTYEVFKRVVKKIGSEKTRIHDLRHTYASLSIQNGDDFKTVSDALGHANIGITLNIYAHVTQQMKKNSAERMQAFINTVKTAGK